MIGVGGIIPASRFLRRRAAAEDLGADVDAFWSCAPPRLYDFSQQQQQQPPRPPSPPPAPRRSPSSPPPPAARRSPSPPPPPEPGSGPCVPTPQRQPSPSPPPKPCSPRLLTLPRQPSTPPPAARRSPSPPPPSPEPCLLTLQRCCVGWGGRRSGTQVGRHRVVGAGDAPPQAAVVEVMDRGDVDGAKKMKRLEKVGKEEQAAAAAEQRARQGKRMVVKAEEETRSRRVTRSGLRRRRGAARRAKKVVPLEVVMKEEEDEVEAAAAEESSQDDKRKVVKTRNRKRGRSGRDRRRGASKRARKIVPVEEEENDEGLSGDKKRKRPVEENAPAAAPAAESSGVKREVVTMEETVVYHRRRRGAAKLAENTPRDGDDVKESKPPAAALVPATGKKVVWWQAPRYAASEAALLDILRARGACAAKPAPRAELRAQARRRIGDTGLLDHLLRHSADKVPAGSDQRIRRRYNAEGALEYWLEPAGLAALRKEAGVDDPYWVPPPGWKLGDPVSPDAGARAMKKHVEELAGELDIVKREIKKLSSNLVHVSKEAYISWKGYDCMRKANENLGKDLLSLEEKYDNATKANGELREELLFLKGNYETMAGKNAKLEEQMVAISSCFQFLKEDLLLPEAEGCQEHVLMLEAADHCVEEPSNADTNKQEARVPVDVAACASISNASAVDEKRTSRKCSMRICKPQGTFQWPNTAAGEEAYSPTALPEPLTPGGDLVLASFDDAVMYNLAPSSLEEYLVADGLPTPTSASSTTAASTMLPLLPTPGSASQWQNTSSSSSPPCLLEAGKKALVLDGGNGNVGTELALTTPSY